MSEPVYEYDHMGNGTSFTESWYARKVKKALCPDTTPLSEQLAALKDVTTRSNKKQVLCWQSSSKKRLFARARFEIREEDSAPMVKVYEVAVVDVDRGERTSQVFFSELWATAAKVGVGVAVHDVINPGLNRMLQECGFAKCPWRHNWLPTFERWPDGVACAPYVDIFESLGLSDYSFA